MDPRAIQGYSLTVSGPGGPHLSTSTSRFSRTLSRVTKAVLLVIVGTSMPLRPALMGMFEL